MRTCRSLWPSFGTGRSVGFDWSANVLTIALRARAAYDTRLCSLTDSDGHIAGIAIHGISRSRTPK
jgi:hypothetical protein